MLSSKALGNKIKSLREQRGFTQSQLATRMNVSRAAVSNWELGNRLPDISMLKTRGRIFCLANRILYTSPCLTPIQRAASAGSGMGNCSKSINVKDRFLHN